MKKIHFNPKRIVKDVILVAICVVFFRVSLKAFSEHFILIRGNSMSPALLDNQIYSKSEPSYKRGEIVAFTYDNDVLVKRIIAIEGDTIECDKNGLTITYKDTKEEITLPFYKTDTPLIIKVPADSFFVVGDNANNSYDSREFGTISKNNILYAVQEVR